MKLQHNLKHRSPKKSKARNDSLMQMLHFEQKASEKGRPNGPTQNDRDPPFIFSSQELIFTRILGHEDIEHGEIWKDSCGCWICDNWAKIRIEWAPNDEIVLKDNI